MPIRNESEWKDRHASRCIALLGWLETCIAAFLFLHILCKSNKHVYTKFTFLHKWSSEWMEFRFNNSKTFSIIGWIHFLLRIGNLETKSAYIFFFQHWRKHRESWYLSPNLFKIGKKEVVKISSNIIIRIIFFLSFYDQEILIIILEKKKWDCRLTSFLNIDSASNFWKVTICSKNISKIVDKIIILLSLRNDQFLRINTTIIYTYSQSNRKKIID